MKKALSLALLALLLPIASIQPADAARQVTVKNETAFTVKGDITYGTTLCRDDHPTISPGGTFQVNIGACLTKRVDFFADGRPCVRMGGRLGDPTSFLILPGKAVGSQHLYCAYLAK